LALRPLLSSSPGPRDLTRSRKVLFPRRTVLILSSASLAGGGESPSPQKVCPRWTILVLSSTSLAGGGESSSPQVSTLARGNDSDSPGFPGPVVPGKYHSRNSCSNTCKSQALSQFTTLFLEMGVPCTVPGPVDEPRLEPQTNQAGISTTAPRWLAPPLQSLPARKLFRRPLHSSTALIYRRRLTHISTSAGI
jgi:hypothetical protein